MYVKFETLNGLSQFKSSLACRVPLNRHDACSRPRPASQWMRVSKRFSPHRAASVIYCPETHDTTTVLYRYVYVYFSGRRCLRWMKQFLELGLDRDMMTQIIVSYSCETHKVTPPVIRVQLSCSVWTASVLFSNDYFEGRFLDRKRM